MQPRMRIYLAVVAVLLTALGVYHLCGRGGGSESLTGDPEKIVAEIDAICRRGDRADAARLVPLTSHADQQVARAAMDALAVLDADAARQTLGGLLRDEKDPQKRAAAAEAYGHTPSSDPQVLAAVLTQDEAPEVRAGAARGLARLSSPQRPEGLPAFVAALRDEDPKVRAWAVRGIERVSGKRFPYDPARSPESQTEQIRGIKDQLRAMGWL